MKNKFFKFGFTLAECMVTLGVIGIITAVSFSTYKPKDTARRFQIASAYKTVATAYYNGLMDGFNPFMPNTDAHTFPGFAIPTRVDVNTRSSILCWGLTRYINVTDTYVNDVALTCRPEVVSGTRTIGIDNILTNNFPHFTAQGNNMAFWVSQMYSNPANENDVRFFLVFVDVNGINRGPNLVAYPGNIEGRELPDRVAFAIFENGRITPIGRTEWDDRMLTARVGYYDEDGNERYDSDSVAFFRAKARAWGYYNGGISNPATEGFDLMDSNTMNDYVRSKLVNSPLLSGFPNLQENIDNVADATRENDYRCNDGDIGACFVYIDEYRW